MSEAGAEIISTFGRTNTRGWASGSWFEECQVEAEEWLIDRLVPKRSYTGMFGRRGAAKSFLALDLACCGALGRPFLGEEITQPFGTIYCVGEKKSRFGKRVEAWRRAREVQSVPVTFWWGVPNLLDDVEVGDFIAAVMGMRAEFTRRGVPLGLIIVDTLARCLRHRNVSDADAVGTALEAIQRIIDEAGVTVMPLAHVAKAEGALSQKGAGEWEDAADALIRIERKENEALRTVTLTKQSDEADGLGYGFELDVIDVGQTPTGRRVTSCVIRQVDLPDTAAIGESGRSHPRLSPQLQLVLKAARIAFEEHPETVPPGPTIPANLRGVKRAAVKARALTLGYADGDEKPESVRRKLNANIRDLIGKGQLGGSENHLWII